MKLKFLALIALSLLITAMSLGGKQIEAPFASTTMNVSEAPLVPEHVLYESVFRLDISFRRRALEHELTGQQITSLKTYFKDETGLTDEQDEELRKTAIAYLEAIQPIDAQAAQIIAQLRQQFPDGEVYSGNEVPPPPSELAALQTQRNAIALEYRERLGSAIGRKFKAFDSFVKDEFAENFNAIGSLRLK